MSNKKHSLPIDNNSLVSREDSKEDSSNLSEFLFRNNNRNTNNNIEQNNNIIKEYFCEFSE